MEEALVFPASFDASFVLASIGNSIIDSVRVPDSAASLADGSALLSVASAADSCKISVAPKHRHRRSAPPTIRHRFSCGHVSISISRGSLDITRRPGAAKKGSCVSPAVPLDPAATLKLVTELIDSAARRFKRLLFSMVVSGVGPNPMALEILFTLYAVKQMKGALSSAEERPAPEKRKRRCPAEDLEGIECSGSEEYIEVLDKLRKMGWNDGKNGEEDDGELVEILKKMKKLMV